METLLKYFLSVSLVLLFTACDNLTQERFHKMTKEERQSASLEYTTLASLLERGSPKHMRILEKAIRLDPQNDRAWRELSLPYLYSGMFEEWSFSISKAIEINPEAWQGWRAHDRMYYCRDFAGALFDLDATDTLTKNQVDYAQNTSVDFLRGVCYLGLNNYSKSEEYFYKYIEDEQAKIGEAFVDETAFLYLGILALKQDQYNLAVQHLLRGIKFEDGYADFHYHLARAYCYLGEYAKAQKEIIIAAKKFDEGNYLRGYRYEAVEQIYKAQITELNQSINLEVGLVTS